MISKDTLFNFFSWFSLLGIISVLYLFFQDVKKWKNEDQNNIEWRKTLKKGDTTSVNIPRYDISVVIIDSIYNDTALVHLVTEKNNLYKK